MDEETREPQLSEVFFADNQHTYEKLDADYLAVLPLDELVEHLEELIHQSGGAWRQLNQVKRSALDGANIRAISAKDEETVTGEQTANRKEHRSRGAPLERQTSTWFRGVIHEAQNCSTLLLLGDEDEQEAGQAMLEYYEEKMLKTEDLDPVEAAAGQLFLDVQSSYLNALRIDEELLTQLNKWLAFSGNRILELTYWLDSDRANLTGEHKPLAEALARVYTDPALKSFLAIYLDNMESAPQMFQRTFITKLGEHATNDPDGDPDISWMGFMPQLLNRAGLNISLEALVTAMVTMPYGQLPASIQERIKTEHLETIDAARTTLKKVLTPFSRPERFVVFGDLSLDFYEPPKSGKKKRSGRVTPKKAVSGPSVRVSEEPEHVSGAYQAVNTPEGYILKDFDAHIPVWQSLFELKKVQDFLQAYASEPRLADEIKLMLLSIIDEPYGNGCEKMSDQTISVKKPDENENRRKTRSVWHLNPNKRSWGNGLSTVAKKTRIFYVMVPNGDGTESICLLDIMHKNTAEQLRGSYRPTR